MNGTNRPDGVREMVKMALLMAMNCVSAYVIIPLPFSLSPISLQTVFVNLLGFLLTPRQVLITMCAYLLMGLAGLPVFTGGTAGPVFTGGTAGPGKLFGPTGGYIFGFLVAALIISWLRGNNYGFKRCAFLGVVIGIPVIYLLGVAQLKFITGIGWEEAVVTGALPFIPMDIVKCIAAAYITAPIAGADG